MSETAPASQRWGPPLKIREDEAPEMCRRRALAGAGYGFLTGSAFALLSGVVDALFLRDLPIYLDWRAILLSWAGYGLVFAISGALTGWLPEGVKGVLAGAAALAVAILGYSLFQAQMKLVAGLAILAIMAFPVAATCLPVAMILRWLSIRHLGSAEKSGLARAGQVAGLVLLALLLGLVPAYFSRTTGRAEESLRAMNTLVQKAAAGQINPRFAARLAEAPGLRAHLGQGYQIRQQTSIMTTEGYEIFLIFADGFQATCTLVVYGSQEPYVSLCVDGALGEP
jgi:hypothetical protein